MLHEYHVIYSVRYYARFHVTAVGVGTYYPWIRGHYFTLLTELSAQTPRSGTSSYGFVTSHLLPAVQL
jgi:hypothetical protein